MESLAGARIPTQWGGETDTSGEVEDPGYPWTAAAGVAALVADGDELGRERAALATYHCDACGGVIPAGEHFLWFAGHGQRACPRCVAAADARIEAAGEAAGWDEWNLTLVAVLPVEVFCDL